MVIYLPDDTTLLYLNYASLDSCLTGDTTGEMNPTICIASFSLLRRALDHSLSPKCCAALPCLHSIPLKMKARSSVPVRHPLSTPGPDPVISDRLARSWLHSHISNPSGSSAVLLSLICLGKSICTRSTSRDRYPETETIFVAQYLLTPLEHIWLILEDSEEGSLRP